MIDPITAINSCFSEDNQKQKKRQIPYQDFNLSANTLQKEAKFYGFFSDLRPMQIQPDHKALLELAHAKMHFGKHKGKFLSELPEFYLVWFRQQGFPKGKLGDQLQQVLDLKLNGIEHILRTVRQKYPR